MGGRSGEGGESCMSDEEDEKVGEDGDDVVNDEYVATSANCVFFLVPFIPCLSSSSSSSSFSCPSTTHVLAIFETIGLAIEHTINERKVSNESVVMRTSGVGKRGGKNFEKTPESSKRICQATVEKARTVVEERQRKIPV